MRIRIQLFISVQIHIHIRIQRAKTTRIHADPDPGQNLKSQKVELSHEKYRYKSRELAKKHSYEGTKALLDRKPGLFVYFG
jgi:hypothetical protein